MAPAILERLGREASEAAAVPTTATSQTSQSYTSSPTPTLIDASTGLGGPSETVTETSPSSSSSSSSNINTTTILIVIIVFCASAIMSAALFYLFDRKKNAQFREACRRDPYLTRKEFVRRRKLSAIERLEEEEMQRIIMIRKSLASREPSRQNSCEDFGISGLQQQQEHHQGRLFSGVWMPRMRSGSETSSSASSASSARHPYVEPHPGVEVELPLTPQSRSPSPSPSPSRTPLVEKTVPPPAVSAMEGISRPLPSLPKPSDANVHLP
ncbi:transcription factor tfiib [Colletotrichum incanum]|uniref:Transcription factor tfiib n=1 Tax=Colletotrichum incanum TaxID=1573173 RepID=A0A166L455_COLIC|nr:transcription factor tfiib [Colletotrichum incanum]OHW93471.1 hypothetical protein CSPAE12_07909 [Colletotrichum incanum]